MKTQNSDCQLSRSQTWQMADNSLYVKSPTTNHNNVIDIGFDAIKKALNHLSLHIDASMTS